MEVAVAHRHVVAVSLEVEGFAVAAAEADVHVAPFAVLENPVLAPEEHGASHAVEGAEAAADVVRDAVFHAAAVHAADAELPLVAFLEEAVLEVEAGEVVHEGGVLVEVVRAVRPEARGETAEDAVFHHDVLHDDPLAEFPREKADAEADLALGVVLVVLVEQRVVEVAVLDPEVFLGGGAFGVFSVDAGNAAGKFEADDLVAAFVVEADAGAVLLEVLAVNEGFFSFTVGADEDGLFRRAAAFGGEFLVPGVTAFEQDAVAGLILDGRFGKRLPRRGCGSAGSVVVAGGLADVDGFRVGWCDAEDQRGERDHESRLGGKSVEFNEDFRWRLLVLRRKRKSRDAGLVKPSVLARCPSILAKFPRLSQGRIFPEVTVGSSWLLGHSAAECDDAEAVVRLFGAVVIVAGAGLKIAVDVVDIKRAAPDADFAVSLSLVVFPHVSVLVECSVSAGGREASCTGRVI